MPENPDIALQAVAECDEARALALTWPHMEEPLTRRLAAIIADPEMGSYLASLHTRDSEIV